MVSYYKLMLRLPRSSVLWITALWKRTQHNDVHNRLMQAYEAVPNSWYYGLLGLMLVAAGRSTDSSTSRPC